MLCKCGHLFIYHSVVVDSFGKNYDYCTPCYGFSEGYAHRENLPGWSWGPYHTLEADKLGYLEKLYENL